MKVALRVGFRRDDPVSPLDGVLRECREKGYDEQDRRNIAAALRNLAPAAVEPVVARLAARKPEFVKVILP